jgi:hypothetical protein
MVSAMVLTDDGWIGAFRVSCRPNPPGRSNSLHSKLLAFRPASQAAAKLNSNYNSTIRLTRQHERAPRRPAGRSPDPFSPTSQQSKAQPSEHPRHTCRLQTTDSACWKRAVDVAPCPPTSGPSLAKMSGITEKECVSFLLGSMRTPIDMQDPAHRTKPADCHACRADRLTLVAGGLTGAACGLGAGWVRSLNTADIFRAAVALAPWFYSALGIGRAELGRRPNSSCGRRLTLLCIRSVACLRSGRCCAAGGAVRSFVLPITLRRDHRTMSFFFLFPPRLFVPRPPRFWLRSVGFGMQHCLSVSAGRNARNAGASCEGCYAKSIRHANPRMAWKICFLETGLR